MTIIITIPDDAAEIWQPVGRALGMQQVTDQEVQTRVGTDFVTALRSNAERGKQMLARDAEQAEIAASLGKISVEVK